MRPKFYTARVVAHRRFRALGETAQTIYLAALHEMNPAHCLALAEFDKIADRPFGKSARDELLRSGLVVAEDVTAWIHLPSVLDRAATMDAMWDDVAARTIARWQSITAEVTTAAHAAGIDADLSLDEWDRGWEALARGVDRGES